MNITKINSNNQRKIIFLTTNNSTPKKLKRFSFSNSNTANKNNKNKYKNKNKIKEAIMNNNLSYKSFIENQKYIFYSYKISPLIAILIYEKSINKLLEFIKKRLPKQNFVEIKKKYISFVTEELHINNKNILLNLSERDLINLNVKLFISQTNSCFFSNYNKLNFNQSPIIKDSSNSNSLFQLNKSMLKNGKLLSFNSFNSELKNQNKSLVKNSTNILIQPKKMKNICNTEYYHKNNYNNNNIINLKKAKYKKKDKGIDIYNHNHLRNISMTNGSPFFRIIDYEYKNKSKSKSKIKEKIINNDKEIIKIFKKYPLNKNKKLNSSKNTIKENKKFKSEDKSNKKNKIDDNSNLNVLNENEKNMSVQQLNLIKENLDDNLKNMFNFSYGNFLNYEKESDSSKSLRELYKNNKDYNYIKKN